MSAHVGNIWDVPDVWTKIALILNNDRIDRNSDRADVSWLRSFHLNISLILFTKVRLADYQQFQHKAHMQYVDLLFLSRWHRL